MDIGQGKERRSSINLLNKDCLLCLLDFGTFLHLCPIAFNKKQQFLTERHHQQQPQDNINNKRTVDHLTYFPLNELPHKARRDLFVSMMFNYVTQNFEKYTNRGMKRKNISIKHLLHGSAMFTDAKFGIRETQKKV